MQSHLRYLTLYRALLPYGNLLYFTLSGDFTCQGESPRNRSGKGLSIVFLTWEQNFAVYVRFTSLIFGFTENFLKQNVK